MPATLTKLKNDILPDSPPLVFMRQSNTTQPFINSLQKSSPRGSGYTSITTYFHVHGPLEAWDGPPRPHHPVGLLWPDPHWRVMSFSPSSHPSVSIPQRAPINIRAAQKSPKGIKKYFSPIMSCPLELREGTVNHKTRLEYLIHILLLPLTILREEGNFQLDVQLPGV